MGSVAALALLSSSSSSLSELPEELLSRAPSGALRAPHAFHTQGEVVLPAGELQLQPWKGLRLPQGPHGACSHCTWAGKDLRAHPSATMGGDIHHCPRVAQAPSSPAWDTSRGK